MWFIFLISLYETEKKILNLRLNSSRLNRKGGGLALIFKTSIEARPQPTVRCESFELLDLLLCFRDQRVRLLVIYRPPSSSPTNFFEELSAVMENVCSTRDRLIITGDFKFHVESLNNATAQSFLGLMEAFGLTQNVDSPTHIRGHTLDLVFSLWFRRLVSNPIL